MKKLLSKLNLENKYIEVISLTLFGSYPTEHWVENRSDIDILVLLRKNDFMLEMQIEEEYRRILEEYFNYKEIHFTFIALNSFDSVFADIYIDYTDKIIFDINLHYDFLMYISKFYRVNEPLIKLIREDWEEKYGVL